MSTVEARLNRYAEAWARVHLGVEAPIVVVGRTTPAVAPLGPAWSWACEDPPLTDTDDVHLGEYHDGELIVLNERLLAHDLATVRGDPRGVWQFACDVLAHELVHHALWHHDGDSDPAHGARFTALANRIGGRMGVAPVVPGDDGALGAACWPMLAVRNYPGRYGLAFPREVVW